MIALPHWALFVTMLAFFALAMVLPVIRMRVRTGDFGIAMLRTRDPVQRVVGAALTAYIVGLGAWTLLYSMVPGALGIWDAPPWVGTIGVVAIEAGFSIVVIAQAEMGASWRIGIDRDPTALVTHGLYGFVRNPIYTGMIVFLLGVVLLTPSAWSTMAFLTVVLVIEIQTRLEERHLAEMHGASFTSYAARVGRFVPWIGRADHGQPQSSR